MNNWQTPIALLLVAVAVVFLVRRALAKRKAPGSCSGMCACPTDKFKDRLKHRPAPQR